MNFDLVALPRRCGMCGNVGVAKSHTVLRRIKNYQFNSLHCSFSFSAVVKTRITQLIFHFSQETSLIKHFFSSVFVARRLRKIEIIVCKTENNVTKWRKSFPTRFRLVFYFLHNSLLVNLTGAVRWANTPATLEISRLTDSRMRFLLAADLNNFL